MAAATEVVLKAKGVDQASSVFKKIGSVLAALSIPAALGKAINELGNLSDIAMRSSTSTEELTQMSAAMDELGIKGGDVESLGRAMQFMQKNTGLAGKAGFAQLVEEIAKLGTAEERAEASMAAFGRAGLNYIPLIEGAVKSGKFEFDELARTMPSVAQGAANVGDAFNDSIGQVMKWAKNSFLNAVGEMLAVFDGFFDGGIRTAVSKGLAHIDNFFNKFKAIFENLGEAWYKFVSEGDMFAFENLGNEIRTSFAYIDEETKKRLADIEAIKNKRADLAVGNAFTEESGMGKIGANVSPLASISNKWLAGGSYAAMTAGLREQMRQDDPQTKELKKSNRILDKIHKKMDEQRQTAAVLEVEGA